MNENKQTATDVLELAVSETTTNRPTMIQEGGALVASSPAGMMMAALSNGVTLEQFGQMMDLQERWEKREAEKSFREDFAAFRGENIIIPKSKHVDRGKAGSFNQAEYDQVAGRLSPSLSSHGFGFRHDQKFGTRRIMTAGEENDIGWVWVTCHLEHRKGHAESLTLEGPPGELSANTPVQNMQATASYLKRQSLLAITGTATGGEDDETKMRRGNDASSEAESPDEQTLQAGRDAAMLGMAALTKWWGALTAKQRSDMSNDFTHMRKAAQAADGANHA